jgi:hypothetical protein
MVLRGRRSARAVVDRLLEGVRDTRGNPLALLELPRGLSPAQLAGGFGVTSGLSLSARIEESFRHQRTSYLDVRALERYRPARHDGPVVFYSARDIQTGGMRDPRFDRDDPSRGWDEVCGEPIEVVCVPGHHLSLLDPPHVEVIAAHLDRMLGDLARAAA